MFSPPKTSGAAWADLFDSWTLFAQSVEILSCLYAEGFKQRNAGMLGYKVAMAMLDVAKATLKQPDGLNALKSAAKSRNNPSSEPLAEIQDFVNKFAKVTYTEFRQRLNKDNRPIEPKIGAIINYYDKTFRYQNQKPSKKSARK
jgi:hypothetical protein